MKQVSASPKCRAKNPQACKYHGAIQKAEKAYSTGDIENYLQAKKDAENTLTDYDSPLLAWLGREKKEREAELASLRTPDTVTMYGAGGEQVLAVHIQAETRPSEPDDPYGSPHSNRWLLVKPTAETSPYECGGCGKLYLHKDVQTFDGETFHCTHCGYHTPPMGANLTPHSLNLLRNPEATKQETWYHVSTNSEWAGIQENPTAVVHLGSRTAAWMRGQALKMEARKEGKPAPTLHLFEVVLKPEATVGEHAYSDAASDLGDKHSHWPTEERRSEEFSDINLDDIHRYVNYWEDPGSVSVFTKTGNISSIKAA